MQLTASEEAVCFAELVTDNSTLDVPFINLLIIQRFKPSCSMATDGKLYCYRLLWDIIFIGSYGTLIYGIYGFSVLRFFSSAEIVGQNPTGAWSLSVVSVVCLSGRCLCEELIARQEESYRLWCVAVCDLETSRMMRLWSALARSATGRRQKIFYKSRHQLYLNCVIIAAVM